MRIVTWNVNSVRVRADDICAFLERQQPDVLALQELKCEDDKYPGERFEELGYESVVYGQKTYNGVSIISRVGAEDVVRGFADGDDEDPHARIIRATCGGVRVAGVYCPNGKAPDTEPFAYKLGWFRRLRAALDTQEDAAKPLVLLGDFNVTVDDRDVWDPDGLREAIHCTAPEREALAHVKEWGLADCLRKHHEEEGIFSWWDYRRAAYWRKWGLRIDFVLANPPLYDACTECVVDEKPRRKRSGASDHAPVVADFDL